MFDRKATTPPDYLERLRNKGWHRCWHILNGYHWSAFSHALGAINFGQQLKTGRNIYLDAGCGYSPDAFLAVEYLDFAQAYKLDLFPINGGVRQIREREQGRVKFFQQDICDLSNFADNSISVISSNAMIDLLKPEERLLFYAEAYRAIEPGGLLSIGYVPLKAGYGDWGDWRELEILRNIGFKHVNTGRISIIIVRKEKK